MSESPPHLKHSVGTPFWIGCLVGPILFIIFLAVLGVLQDSFAFWVFVGVAVVVFGPIGGMASQAVHDLLVARRLRLFHIWDFLVFTAIAVAMVVAGEGLFHSSGRDSDPFKNRTFALAGAAVVLILLVYATSKNIAHFLSGPTWIAILITVGLVVICGTLYKLTGFDLGWIMGIATGLWAAIDSSKIQLKRYRSGISYGPGILFIGFVFVWFITLPWYLIVRHKIKTGRAVLNDESTKAA